MTESRDEVSSPEKILGNEKITEICQSFQLAEDDTAIVIRILRRWETLTGKATEKFAIGIEETLASEKRRDILMALKAVTKELAQQTAPPTTIH